MRTLEIRHEVWPISGAFTISRGSRTEVDLLAVEIGDEGVRGRAECVPYPRYGESIESVIAEIEAARAAIEAGIHRGDLLDAMKPGAARNGVDCALWDLEAKHLGERVWDMATLREPKDVLTAYTISIDTPQKMQAAASSAIHMPLLKVKLDGDVILERLEAVRSGSPSATIIVDANEAWSIDDLVTIEDRMDALGVILIEQPLPAGKDGALKEIDYSIPLCADESFHNVDDLDEISERYQCVNVKLDKTGGLTEGLRVAKAARDRGLMIMVGCMLCTSLGVAPALMLESFADYVDLDGPLLLARDHSPGIPINGALMGAPPVDLWG